MADFALTAAARTRLLTIAVLACLAVAAPASAQPLGSQQQLSFSAPLDDLNIGSTNSAVTYGGGRNLVVWQQEMYEDEESPAARGEAVRLVIMGRFVNGAASPLAEPFTIGDAGCGPAGGGKEQVWRSPSTAAGSPPISTVATPGPVITPGCGVRSPTRAAGGTGSSLRCLVDLDESALDRGEGGSGELGVDPGLEGQVGLGLDVDVDGLDLEVAGVRGDLDRLHRLHRQGSL